jgi:hypothetical protein
MSTFSDSSVSRLLFATPALGRVVGVTSRRWRWLAAPLFDPYRPELHCVAPARNGEKSTRGTQVSRAPQASAPR